MKPVGFSIGSVLPVGLLARAGTAEACTQAVFQAMLKNHGRHVPASSPLVMQLAWDASAAP